MEIIKRCAILKNHENDCYSICVYLLQCENLACEAAKNALYNLIISEKYFVSNPNEKNDLICKESMKSALQLKKKSIETIATM
jgi:hypothetical protein